MTEQPQDAPDEPLEPVTGEPGWADDEPEVAQDVAEPDGPAMLEADAVEADAVEPDAVEPDVVDEPAERVRTGVERVDEVIRAVEELEERPLEEHVGVFESAQVQLRRALDDPGDDDQPGGAEHGDDHLGHA